MPVFARPLIRTAGTGATLQSSPWSSDLWGHAALLEAVEPVSNGASACTNLLLGSRAWERGSLRLFHLDVFPHSPHAAPALLLALLHSERNDGRDPAHRNLPVALSSPRRWKLAARAGGRREAGQNRPARRQNHSTGIIDQSPESRRSHPVPEARAWERNRGLDAYLARWVYAEQNPIQLFSRPIDAAFCLLTIGLIFTVGCDIARRKQLRYGRRLRRPEMLEPAALRAVAECRNAHRQTR